MKSIGNMASKRSVCNVLTFPSLAIFLFAVACVVFPEAIPSIRKLYIGLFLSLWNWVTVGIHCQCCELSPHLQ